MFGGNIPFQKYLEKGSAENKLDEIPQQEFDFSFTQWILVELCQEWYQS